MQPQLSDFGLATVHLTDCYQAIQGDNFETWVDRVFCTVDPDKGTCTFGDGTYILIDWETKHCVATVLPLRIR